MLSRMAAEAVHMTALDESVLGPRVPTAREVSSLVERHRSLARFGAVLVDLAYFEGFGSVALRHITGLPPARSAWGDRFHNGPTELLFALLRRVRDGRASELRGGPGKERVLAVAMGLASHLAVDVVTHPLINRIADARAKTLGTSEATEHQIVERMQSVVFHERFLGRNIFGRNAFYEHLAIPAHEVIDDDRFWRLLESALVESFGRAPSRFEVRAWARGYRQYARVLGSPLGRLLVTESDKEEAQDVLYRGKDFDFDDVFKLAEKKSTEYVESAYAFARGDIGENVLQLDVPVQSIDHPIIGSPWI